MLILLGIAGDYNRQVTKTHELIISLIVISDYRVQMPTLTVIGYW
jgi:hypothetical protein